MSDRPFKKDPEAVLAAALSDEALDALERRTNGTPEAVEGPEAAATWEAGAGLSARELRGAWKQRA